MKPEDVQNAIKKLQQYLLEEYGWDTQGSTTQQRPSSTAITQPKELTTRSQENISGSMH
jgi:hypothetical protein